MLIFVCVSRITIVNPLLRIPIECYNPERWYQYNLEKYSPASCSTYWILTLQPSYASTMLPWCFSACFTLVSESNFNPNFNPNLFSSSLDHAVSIFCRQTPSPLDPFSLSLPLLSVTHPHCHLHNILPLYGSLCCLCNPPVPTSLWHMTFSWHCLILPQHR